MADDPGRRAPIEGRVNVKGEKRPTGKGSSRQYRHFAELIVPLIRLPPPE